MPIIWTFGWRHLLTFTLSIMQILLSPLLLLLFLPLYLFRYIVDQLSRHFCPGHGKILNSQANVFAADYPAMFKTRTDCSLGVELIMEKCLSIEEVRQIFGKPLIKVNSSGLKEYPLPEMVQTIKSWMGYLFWAWEKDFKIENHIKMYDGPKESGNENPISERELQEIFANNLHRPFDEGTSPWEIWVFNNVQMKGLSQSRQVIVFKFHHFIGDGYSFAKFAMEESLGPKIVDMLPKQLIQPVKGPLETIWMGLRFILRAPFDTINMIIQAHDFNEWRLPERKLTGNMIGAKSEPVSIATIKHIKNFYGVSFHAVIHAAVAGGFRNFMIEQNIKIPKRFHCCVILPVKGHPTKMRNHATVAFLPLPLQVADPRDRLKFVEESFQSLRNSTAPLILFAMSSLTGLLPLQILKMIRTQLPCTCIMTNFPGPTKQIFLNGKPVLEMTFAGGLHGNISLGCCSLSYNGKLIFAAGGDKAIFPNPEMAQNVVDKISQELKVLEAAEIV